MPIATEFTRLLGIKYPIVQGGMQWVGTPPLAAAVARAGGLGILTALTQPSPEALREAIKETRRLLGEKQGKFVSWFTGGTMLALWLNVSNAPTGSKYYPSSVDQPSRLVGVLGELPLIRVSAGYTRAALEEGIDIFETAGNNRAGHPGEEDIGGLVLLAKAAKELTIPYIASGGFADGRGLAAALSLGAAGVNMGKYTQWLPGLTLGTRFMCTVESPIHQSIKEKIVRSTEKDTIHIFRTLGNTARVYRNSVSTRVVELEKRPQGAKFEDLRELVAGARGRKVYETGDYDAGIWSAGIAIGLIDDIPTCASLIERIDQEASDVIKGLSGLIDSQNKAKL
ncbi:hypothetical protein LQV05_005586 [Cryptococcus neoformans]|nr:hypothetical protein LQV05_005586 [Cryptococcus neoformans]